ncbi:DNA mismatch repair protein mutH [Legionella quinlivanii]|uniref:DNA mismatch repair protein MutH n=1 Tax=Legionella quinlivanii TaxID=45073 RepID=A0A0W0Y4G4_9GAMM|nr:DNA mismatch repair endonuclease MutH [Legionella quinlivanii]KTD51538.1 DNA mismatch repair protein mutH [Legionella quinlivanii]SEF58303.1 DNA mismatch repair protein MutH [Legionella quinlivanii DSM 21216]STY10935.1 DNA mismatch repair protein mutH [Legionella quinlivanii]
MSLSLCKNVLSSESELLTRCSRIAGLSFSQLACLTQCTIPQKQSQRKGWTGLAIELALGTTAGTKAVPDFENLGVELKTIPLNALGKPAESTFVTSISLTSIHRETWKESQCFQKLKRILWVPVEGDTMIPFEQRRIGSGFLWSPSEEQECILSDDWHEHSTMIGMGRLEEIDASMGEYLQVRPKAANARSLCDGFDAEGKKIRTLPRGFYLRASFTQQLLKSL